MHSDLPSIYLDYFSDGIHIPQNIKSQEDFWMWEELQEDLNNLLYLRYRHHSNGWFPRVFHNVYFHVNSF